MLMYSWSSSPHPATFLSRSFRPSKSAAWKTSTQLWYWQRGAYVYFAVHVEVEELVEEVGELLHLEGGEEPLQLRKVGDVVRPLGPIVGSDHRAHLAAAFTALPPTATGGRLGRPAECVVQNTDGRAWLQARGGESTYNTADTCINTNTKIQKYKYNHTKIKIQKYKNTNTKIQKHNTADTCTKVSPFYALPPTRIVVQLVSPMTSGHCPPLTYQQPDQLSLKQIYKSVIAKHIRTHWTTRHLLVI